MGAPRPLAESGSARPSTAGPSPLAATPSFVFRPAAGATARPLFAVPSATTTPPMPAFETAAGATPGTTTVTTAATDAATTDPHVERDVTDVPVPPTPAAPLARNLWPTSPPPLLFARPPALSAPKPPTPFSPGTATAVRSLPTPDTSPMDLDRTAKRAAPEAAPQPETLAHDGFGRPLPPTSRRAVAAETAAPNALADPLAATHGEARLVAVRDKQPQAEALAAAATAALAELQQGPPGPMDCG
jgi:hypothetical protein